MSQTRVSIANPKRFIAALVLILIIVVALVMWLWPEGAPSPTAEPSPLPCRSACDSASPVLFSVPAKDEAESAAYRRAAYPVAEESAFIAGFPENRGLPLQFDAYLPPDALTQDNPNFLTTKEACVPGGPAGCTYIPARFAPRAKPAALQQLVTADSEVPATTIILAVPSDIAPETASVFANVLGSLYWDYSKINPADTNGWPVVVVNTIEPVTLSELKAPAIRTVQPEIFTRQGDLRIDVESIEFAPPVETRVRLKLVNTSSRQTVSWPAETARIISPDAILQPITEEDEGARVGETINASDIPPGGAGISTLARTGYIYFPPIPTERDVVLELPLPVTDERTESPVLRIQIPGISASAAR